MPIRLWSTVVSHAHTSLLMCALACRNAGSGIAMLGWPPAVYEVPQAWGSLALRGCRGQGVAQSIAACKGSWRSEMRMRDNSRELRVRPWAARLRRRGRHRPVFLAEGGEDDAQAHRGQATPKEESIASQGDVAGLLLERLDHEPTDLLVERPSEPDK